MVPQARCLDVAYVMGRVHLQVLFRLAPILAASLSAVGTIHQQSSAQVPVQLPLAAPGVLSDKIHFDLSAFNEDGLYGPPDGLRSAAYEFCIPARQDLAGEVLSIDPTVQIYPSSPGRIGCGSDEYLCIGSTGRTRLSRGAGGARRTRVCDPNRTELTRNDCAIMNCCPAILSDGCLSSACTVKHLRP